MDTLGNIFHVNLIGYLHWFISIIISQLRGHFISLDQASYATSVVEKYLDTAKIKENSNFCKTTLPHDIIFTQGDSYTND